MDVEVGAPDFFKDFRQTQQVLGSGQLQNADCASDQKTSRTRNLARFGLVHNQAIGMNFLGQTDGFAFAWIQME